MNRRGGLEDRRRAPLLGAHGAAVDASLVVLVVRHVGGAGRLCVPRSTLSPADQEHPLESSLTACCSSEKEKKKG